MTFTRVSTPRGPLFPSHSGSLSPLRVWVLIFRFGPFISLPPDGFFLFAIFSGEMSSLYFLYSHCFFEAIFPGFCSFGSPVLPVVHFASQVKPFSNAECTSPLPSLVFLFFKPGCILCCSFSNRVCRIFTGFLGLLSCRFPFPMVGVVPEFPFSL